MDWSKVRVSVGVALVMLVSAVSGTIGLVRWLISQDYATRNDVKASVDDLKPLLTEVRSDMAEQRQQVQSLAREVSELRGSLGRLSP